MGSRKFTESELRHWRILAALQEMCYASDADVDNDPVLNAFLDRCARAIFTYQNTKLRAIRLEEKADVLKEVGIPVLGKK